MSQRQKVIRVIITILVAGSATAGFAYYYGLPLWPDVAVFAAIVSIAVAGGIWVALRVLSRMNSGESRGSRH